MRVLFVCSRRDYSPHTDYMAPFVYEQMRAVESLGVDCKAVLIDKGLKGYFKAVKNIKKEVKDSATDTIHAHYGLCGIVANFQRKIPVVTTYHGSDLNTASLRVVSWLSIALSKTNIVVSEALKKKALCRRKIHVIPCGIDTGLLTPMSKEEARRKLGWDTDKIYILFSKEFFNKEKNYPLAKAAVDCYNDKYSDGNEAELLEFIGYTREQVHWLYNAVDCVLMTSNHEGSPQFIKEAMSCNCPVVSVDVGDVKQVISDTDGCYLAERDPQNIANKLDSAIKHGKANGREKILEEYDSIATAKKVIEVYKEVLEDE